MTKLSEIPHIKLMKVVQLYIDGKPLFGVENEHTSYHVLILEECLRKEGIEFNLIPIDNGNDFGPALKGERYRAVGMGFLIKGGNKFYFSGSSQDYGIGIDKTHLEDYKQSVENLEMIVSS